MGRGGGGWEGSSRLERLGREIQVLEPPFGNVEREKKQKRVHFGEISVAAGLPQVWSCHAQYLWGSSTCKAPIASERRYVIQQMCQIPSTNPREWRALYAGQLGISVLPLTCCMTLDKELNLSFSIKLGSAHLTELLRGLNVTMYQCKGLAQGLAQCPANGGWVAFCRLDLWPLLQARNTLLHCLKACLDTGA